MVVPDIKAVSVEIPADLFREFKTAPRIVIKHPTMIGVPISFLLKPELLNQFKGYDIYAVPKEFTQ